MALADELDPRRRRAGGRGATGYEGIGGAQVLPGQMLPFLQGNRTWDFGGGIQGQGGLAALLQSMAQNPGQGRGPAMSHLQNQGVDFPPGLFEGGGPGGPNMAPGNLDNGQALSQPGLGLGRVGGQLPPGQAMHQQGWRNFAPGYGAAASLGYGTPEFGQHFPGMSLPPAATGGGGPGQKSPPPGAGGGGGGQTKPGVGGPPGGAPSEGGGGKSRFGPPGGRTGSNTTVGEPAPKGGGPKVNPAVKARREPMGQQGPELNPPPKPTEAQKARREAPTRKGGQNQGPVNVNAGNAPVGSSGNKRGPQGRVATPPPKPQPPNKGQNTTPTESKYSAPAPVGKKKSTGGRSAGQVRVGGRA